MTDAEPLIFGLPLPVALMAAGVTLTVVLAALALLAPGGGKKRRRRVDAVAGRAAGAGAGAVAANGGLRRANDDSSGIAVLDHLITRLLPRPERLRNRLYRTGKRITLGGYVLAMLITGTVFALIMWRLVGLGPIASSLFGVACGFGLPHLVTGILIGRRRARFLKLFPQAIDLIIRGLKSGLPVAESIKVVASEIGEPVGGDFQRVTENMALGQEIEAALWDVAERVDTPEFRFFVVSISVQRETGGNLAETLENLSDVLRKRQQTKLKIKAMSSEARASAIIIGALPFIMFFIIGLQSPDYVSVLFTDVRGNIMLGIGLFWLCMGFGAMAKMVRFEI